MRRAEEPDGCSPERALPEWDDLSQPPMKKKDDDNFIGRDPTRHAPVRTQGQAARVI
jgi:hypothetical protein